MFEAHMLHVMRVARAIKLNNWPFDARQWYERGEPRCLGGYMTFDKEFKRLGLRIHIRQGMPAYPIFGPRGDEWLAEDALANLLGLNEVEAKFLFGQRSDITEIDRTLGDEQNTSIDAAIARVQRVMDGEFVGETTWLNFKYPYRPATS